MTPEEHKAKKAEGERKLRAKDPEKYLALGRERNRKYRDAHREEYNRRQHEWEVAHRRKPKRSLLTAEFKRERDRKRAAVRYAANRDKEEVRKAAIERVRKWILDNREKEGFLEKRRAITLKSAERHRAEKNAQARKWRTENVEQCRLKACHSARIRRALKTPAPGVHTQKDILDLYETQGGKCANPACGVAFATTGKHRYHVDHIVPLTPRKGKPAGTNGPENLQLLCKDCNHSKGNLDPADWATRIRRR